MNILRVDQMNSGIEYVKAIFGRDCSAIFTDCERDTIYVYSNRPLAGYKQHNGIYVRGFDSKKWDKAAINGVGTDARFMPFHNTLNSFGNISYTERKLLNWEKLIGLEQLRADESGYAHVPSIRFWSSLYANIRFPNIPDDSIIVHEITHGVLHDPDLEIFTNVFEMKGVEEYQRASVIDEAVATFVGLEYIREKHPESLDYFLFVLKTTEYRDPIHENASRIVLEYPVLMRDIVRKLAVL
ncbi:MAG: hypothetical protein HZB65_04365 [Candidatus Aenigmarchaeota archaeon]|nr:hypothetical protein [Candidatus Aenigmarchaeota archaeon]